VKRVKTNVMNTTRRKPIPSKRIANLAEIVFSGERRTGAVNVVLIGDKRMRSLNKAYRGVDSTTDVLSFALEDDEIDQPPPDPDSLTGEIYISLDRAQKQADTQGHDLDDEILFLACHGFLHLLGYTHDTKTKFDNIIKKQLFYLNKLYRKK